MTSDSSTVVPGYASAALLDATEVIARLDVKQAAEEAGKEGRPPEQATDLDVNERRVVVYYENVVDAERGRALEALDELERKLKASRNDIKPGRDLAELARITSSMQENHDRLCAEQGAELRTMRLEQERCLRDLRYFRSVNDLKGRQADYPESTVYHFSWVAAIALIEWISLSSFYANGSDFGLLGGVLIAGTFSVVNLVLMVVAGYCFRYINAPRDPLQRVYVSVAALCCVFFLFITFIAAHYRVAVERLAAARLAGGDASTEADQFRATQDAWQNFLANPVGLGDAWAWLVVIFAITFGLFALYKGFTSDDPFPGYRKVDQDAKRAAADYADKAAATRSAQSAVFDTARADLKRVTANAKLTIETFDKGIVAIDARIRSFEQFVDVAERNCNHVVMAYRQFNRYVVASPRPQYFDRPVVLDAGLKAPLPDIDAELREAQQQHHKESEELDKRFTERSVALQAICNVCIKKLEDMVAKIERDIAEEMAREPHP